MGSPPLKIEICPIQVISLGMNGPHVEDFIVTKIQEKWKWNVHISCFFKLFFGAILHYGAFYLEKKKMFFSFFILISLFTCVEWTFSFFVFYFDGTYSIACKMNSCSWTVKKNKKTYEIMKKNVRMLNALKWK